MSVDYGAGEKQSFSLAVLNGSEAGKVFRTTRKRISVGASPESDLVLTGADVSPSHFMIVVDDSGWRAQTYSPEQRIVIDRRWAHPTSGRRGALIYAGSAEILLFPGDLDDQTIQREIRLRAHGNVSVPQARDGSDVTVTSAVAAKFSHDMRTLTSGGSRDRTDSAPMASRPPPKGPPGSPTEPTEAQTIPPPGRAPARVPSRGVPPSRVSQPPPAQQGRVPTVVPDTEPADPRAPQASSWDRARRENKAIPISVPEVVAVPESQLTPVAGKMPGSERSIFASVADINAWSNNKPPTPAVVVETQRPQQGGGAWQSQPPQPPQQSAWNQAQQPQQQQNAWSQAHQPQQQQQNAWAQAHQPQQQQNAWSQAHQPQQPQSAWDQAHQPQQQQQNAWGQAIQPSQPPQNAWGQAIQPQPLGPPQSGWGDNVREEAPLLPHRRDAGQLAPPIGKQITIEQLAEIAGDAALTLIREPDGAYATNARLLGTRVEELVRTFRYRVYMLTSAEPLTGKTTTAINLALALAEDRHRRIALVEANFRFPRIAEIFKLPPDMGIMGVLEGRYMVQDAIIRIADRNLVILPAGGKSAHPAQLLSSPRFKQLMAELADNVDVALVDAPSVLPYADTNLILPLVDAALLVGLEGSTRNAWLEQATGQLNNAGGDRVLGALYNRIPGGKGRTVTGERKARLLAEKEKGR